MHCYRYRGLQVACVQVNPGCPTKCLTWSSATTYYLLKHILLKNKKINGSYTSLNNNNYYEELKIQLIDHILAASIFSTTVSILASDRLMDQLPTKGSYERRTSTIISTTVETLNNGTNFLDCLSPVARYIHSNFFNGHQV